MTTSQDEIKRKRKKFCYHTCRTTFFFCSSISCWNLQRWFFFTRRTRHSTNIIIIFQILRYISLSSNLSFLINFENLKNKFLFTKRKKNSIDAEETMLAWDRWVAKSSAARTTAIQAETKKARLCFVRFLARNASISRRDRQYTFLRPHNTSDGDHDIQAIGCEPGSPRFVGMPKPHRGVDYRNFTGFRYSPPAFSSSIYHPLLLAPLRRGLD